MLTFEHADDECFVAYHYPYPCSSLQSYLDARMDDPAVRNMCLRTRLCTSIAGNPCDLLTVRDCLRVQLSQQRSDHVAPAS